MKKILSIAGILFSLTNGYSQCSGMAATGLTLQCSGGTINRCAVAYNPLSKVYYSADAGATSYPLETFSSAGSVDTSATANVDLRGLWWNPATNVLEGTTIASSNIDSIGLNPANGYAKTGYTTSFMVSQSMGQSCGTYDADSNEIVYYSSGNIYRFSRATGSLKYTTPITGVSTANLNSEFIGYTGTAGTEYLVYDYSAQALYYLNRAGQYVKQTLLPSGAPSNGAFRASYCNKLFWLYNTGTSKWIAYNLSGGNATTATITRTACDSIISPSGKYIWKASGTFMDTIPNKAGCDSIITVNVTINSNTGDTIASVCGNFIWYGTNYKTSGTPTHKFTNIHGCDSIVTLHLTINPSPALSISGNVIGGINVCGNEKDTLKANVTGTGPFSYSWNTGQTKDSVQATPVLSSKNMVSTVAGNIAGGSNNGTDTAASFTNPVDVAYDGKGNLYVADYTNNEIRKIVLSTGVVSTFAGSTAKGSSDGVGASASFWGPTSICTDGKGNLYVADANNNEIRKIVIATDSVSTFAGSVTPGSNDGKGTAASFSDPSGICADGSGNLFVADGANNEIRKIVIATDSVSTFAGSTAFGSKDSIGTKASFYAPWGICTDGKGNLYVGDAFNNEIRKIVIATATVSTLAGNTPGGSNNGTGTAASFLNPNGVTYNGGNLYVADEGNFEIRKIDVATAVVTTFAGNTAPGFKDGADTTARFNVPTGICTGAGSTLYVADQGNNKIRKITQSSNKYIVTVIDGNGCISTDSVTISQKSLPVVSITGKDTITQGVTDTLTASGGVSYVWTSGSSADTAIVSPSAKTTYTVTATDANGCKGTASFTVVVNSTVSVPELSSSNSATAYPNPVINTLNLAFKVNGNTQGKIEITDASGRVISTSTETLSNGKEVYINVTNLAQGMYFVRVVTGKQVQVIKFIKQ